MVDAREIFTAGCLVPDWIPESWALLLPGTALWALAVYLPLSAPLSRLEEALAAGPLDESSQLVALVVSSLLLALGAGAVINLALGWTLGPGWGTSLGLMAALYGLFWGLAASRNE
ncbi:MAG: hypothetical protein FJ070_11080 [Cyanobacteria bacterium K_DeepCast_150m_m2_101]|nr:hypothetical protein [Cyanobacteria bacterium K_DeepCast_150m_m2_101]